ANSGARFETFALSMEQRLPTRTYLGLTGGILNSHLKRTVGAFLSDGLQFTYPISYGFQEDLDYTEDSLLFYLNQLVGNRWSFGARYHLSRAELDSDFGALPRNITYVDFQPEQHVEGVLHNFSSLAVYNHPRGFVASVEANWYAQQNSGYKPSLKGEDIWQVNAFAGYRSVQRRAELVIGVLNLADQDYRLNPLNLYSALPRHRTLTLRFKFSF